MLKVSTPLLGDKLYQHGPSLEVPGLSYWQYCPSEGEEMHKNDQISLTLSNGKVN